MEESYTISPVAIVTLKVLANGDVTIIVNEPEDFKTYQGNYNISKLIEVSNGLIKTVDALKDLVKKAVDSNDQIKLLYSVL
mmetsp:Transcript_17973/g.20011  ORF Transcript_17973/g.20011 Transcript_17973/m.20011 type:complete len:81 (+) Transcript_17973:466-708(+)